MDIIYLVMQLSKYFRIIMSILKINRIVCLLYKIYNIKYSNEIYKNVLSLILNILFFDFIINLIGKKYGN